MAISITLSADMDNESKDKFIQELIAECSEVSKSNPDNRCVKYCKEYLESDEGKGLDVKGECQSSYSFESFYTQRSSHILLTFSFTP